MTLEELEKRVEVLEDIEAIKRLKFRYARVCDSRFDPDFTTDRFVELFAEDAVWDAGEAFGRYQGKEEIGKLIEGIGDVMTFGVHYFALPYIEVEGNRACAQWYTLSMQTKKDGQDVVLSGVEHDKYEKVNGQWLISEMKFEQFFFSPLKEGWQGKAI